MTIPRDTQHDLPDRPPNVSVDRAWSDIERALSERTNPLRTPVLGSIRNQRPAVRTVVLRGVDRARRRLWCFTDARTGKVQELQSNASAEWLFYNPRCEIQYRLLGATTVHQLDQLARDAWNQVAPVAQTLYSSGPARGQPLSPAREALPDKATAEPVSYIDFERAAFAVLVTTVSQIDGLQLAPSGNKRAVYRWQDGQWAGGPVAA